MNIALVGNQNCGKTTLFNALTGSNQKVGNWAGVTVEKKTGIIKGTNHTLIDLPGIYSLTPYTIEEKISCNYIKSNNADLIINLIDSTCLERSLYLTTQLIESNCKFLVALNMCEILEKNGQALNEKHLSQILALPCIKISAIENKNLDTLINLINKNEFTTSQIDIYPKKIEDIISKVTNTFTPKTSKFSAIQLLTTNYNNNSKNSFFNEVKELENKYKIDIEHIFSYEKYNFIAKVKSKCVSKTNKNKNNSVAKNIKKPSSTDRLDKIFLNKYLAIPIFILIMAFVYFLSVGVVGKFSSNLISSSINSLSNFLKTKLTAINTNPAIISLLCDGIITGVGSVINFVPQLIVLFLCISILETTGYMSRISFIFDKLFRKIGLSGKSLIPFIVGSGCSVPAIMSTRTIENSHEKQTTITLAPFIPCSAKLPIITLFTGYFFTNSALVTTLIYLFSIILIIFSAFIIRKFILTQANNTFIFELPEYKRPNLKYVFIDVSQKTLSFIKRAGTIILVCSVVVWVLVSFSPSLTYGVDIEDSILAKIGNLFAWIFYPVLNTYSWGATVSAIQGLIAKEQVISSMSVIAGLSDNMVGASIFTSAIFSFFTPVTALSFIAFNLFSAPCFGAISAMKSELGGTKATLIAIVFQTLTALIISTLITFFGNLILFIF